MGVVRWFLKKGADPRSFLDPEEVGLGGGMNARSFAEINGCEEVV